MSLDQLAHSVESITGFRWTWGSYDMLDNDLVGVRSLSGGRDGRSAQPARPALNASQLLVHSRLAELAADHVLSSAEQAHLFDVVDPSLPLSSVLEAELREQLVSLHRSVLTQQRSPQAAIIDAELALLYELEALEVDPVQAWKGVLMALFRDPEFILY